MNTSIQNKSREDHASPATGIAPIPATAQPREVHEPGEIAEILARLLESRAPVLIFPMDGGQALTGSIVSIETERSHFVMQLQEEAILPAGDCTAVAWVGHATFQFYWSEGERQCDPGQPQRVSSQIPRHCLLLDRRASARQDAPLGGNNSASFRLGDTYIESQLHDISLGGVALRCAPRDASRLYVGRKLQKVSFELGPDGDFVCDLEIRLVRRFRSFLAGEQVHVGCRFIEVTPHMEQVLRSAIARMTGSPEKSEG